MYYVYKNILYNDIVVYMRKEANARARVLRSSYARRALSAVNFVVAKRATTTSAQSKVRRSIFRINFPRSLQRGLPRCWRARGYHHHRVLLMLYVVELIVCVSRVYLFIYMYISICVCFQTFFEGAQHIKRGYVVYVVCNATEPNRISISTKCIF